MPSRLPKMKSLAISKMVPELTKANIHTGTFVAKIGGMSSFEHLELISKNVLIPVLSNQTNQLSWGDLKSQNITDCFHSFLSSSAILCGQVKAETRLPTPPLYGGGENSNSNVSGNGNSNGPLSESTNRISLLESTIITWTKQIKNVLKQDPETQLKLGFHPTPDVEISFWKNKANNLNSIFEQLQSPSTRRVLKALDQAKSTYCTTFARLCKEVYAARLEANDNMKNLKTLEKWVNKLNEEDFGNLSVMFKPMLHTLMLIWKHSTYYNTPSRLVILV